MMVTGQELERGAHTNPPQLLRLIARAIKRRRLDLTGLHVLTEAGPGFRCVTPLIAALAGAEVFAVTRDTPDAARRDVDESTRLLARLAFVEERIHLLSSRLQAPASRIDVITSLPGVRPIDEAALRGVSETASVTLMAGVQQWHNRDVDVAACRRLGVPVAGVDEEALGLHRFMPVAALWGLLATGVVPSEAKVLLAGCGAPLANVAKGLARAGVRVVAAAADSAGRLALYDAEKAGDSLADEDVHALLPELDALVLCPARRDVRLVGPGTGLDAAELSARAPHVAVINLGGEIDRRSLLAEGLLCWPASDSAAPYELLPQPLIEIHAAGLKVGEVLTRARRRGSSPPAAEQLAAETAHAELLPRDLAELRR